MSDDYLFDGKGSDPEVEHLEAVLRPHRYRPRARRPRLAMLAIAATLVLAIGGALLWPAPKTPWGVQTASCEGCLWQEGSYLDTTADAVAHLADRGTLRATAGTRIRLQDREGRARLSLDAGQLEVQVNAPARWLTIAIPGVEVVDLGCAYSLAVADDGTGVLVVRSGSVALEGKGHPTFVPAGAAAASWPNGHTGLPVVDGASAALVEAVDAFDRGAGSREAVLAESTRTVDAITLWHLLSRAPEGSERQRIGEQLQRILPGMAPSPQELAHADEATLEALLGFVIGRTL